MELGVGDLGLFLVDEETVPDPFLEGVGVLELARQLLGKEPPRVAYLGPFGRLLAGEVLDLAVGMDLEYPAQDRAAHEEALVFDVGNDDRRLALGVENRHRVCEVDQVGAP